MRAPRVLLAVVLAATSLAGFAGASPAGAAVPDAPSSISISAGVHQVTVDWEDSSGADRYVARLFPTARQITTTSGPVTFDRLVAGVEYTVEVTPVDDVDGAGESISISGTPADVPAEPPALIQVSAGADNSCAVLDDGSLRCWGSDLDGQLGDGPFLSDGERFVGDDEMVVARPAVPVGARVVQVDVGEDHVCALTETGAVRCWGFSRAGALGHPGVISLGFDDLAADRGDVPLGATATQIVVGAGHSCALTVDGAVRCWGAGSSGQLGTGSTDDVGDDEAPSSVGDVALGAVAHRLAAGAAHTCAVTEDLTLKCWGWGLSGQLGYGGIDDIGDDELPSAAAEVPLDTFVVDAVAGGRFTCALTADAAARCWGAADEGQLGNGDASPIGDDEDASQAAMPAVGAPITALAAGSAHACATTDAGAVRCWGRNISGQAGASSASLAVIPVGPVVDLGGDTVDIDLGWQHTCALLDDDTVRCFGDNGAGQLGIGRDTDIGDDEDPADEPALDFVTAPGAPGMTTSVGETAIAVNLGAPAENGGAAITSYRVTAEPGGATAIRTSPGVVTLEDLDPGTTYTIQATATNSYGTSAATRTTATTAGTPGITPTRSGYWMADDAGTVFAFGDAGDFSAVTLTPGATLVDLDATPSGAGLWILDSGGVVHTLGDAQAFGNVAAGVTGTPTTLAPTPGGDGYWIFTTTGDVSSHGTAVDHGDLTNLSLNGPIIASAATTTGGGYWLLGTDGGVFALGDAEFFGSMGGVPLNQPVNGITPDPDGDGYWLVASDGGVFAFSAVFLGSMGSTPLNAPVTGLIPYGNGYAMVATDGGAFVFSDEPFLGSLGGQVLDRPIVAMTAIG